MSSKAQPSPTPRITAPAFSGAQGSPDAPSSCSPPTTTTAARLVELAGVDSILVGDSLGMTVLGENSTLPVTMEDIGPSDARGQPRGQPRPRCGRHAFMSVTRPTSAEGMRNAARLIAEGGAQAVKLEGATDDTLMPR